jgi:D-alanine-D-alanine ligase
MDKLIAKRALAAAGVPVVEYAAVRRAAFEDDPETFVERAAELPGPPWFVKPAVGGSSVGVRKVKARGELREAVEFALRFDEAVLVERAVAGRELECAVLGYRELEASEIGEIVSGREFYDYEDKYVTDGAQLIAPAELPADLAGRIRELAVEAFAALGGVGLARVDFLVEEVEGVGPRAWVNEINTLPGFTRISMYPRLWGLSGVPLPELVDRLVTIALERHADRHRLDAGIKAFLDSLVD